MVHADANLMITSSRIQIPGDDGSLSDVTIMKEFRVPEYEYYVVESGVELEPKEGASLTCCASKHTVLNDVRQLMEFAHRCRLCH